jgi:hypothetical protein
MASHRAGLAEVRAALRRADAEIQALERRGKQSLSDAEFERLSSLYDQHLAGRAREKELLRGADDTSYFRKTAAVLFQYYDALERAGQGPKAAPPPSEQPPTTQKAPTTLPAPALLVPSSVPSSAPRSILHCLMGASTSSTPSTSPSCSAAGGAAAAPGGRARPAASGLGTESPRASGLGTESPRASGLGTESPRATAASLLLFEQRSSSKATAAAAAVVDDRASLLRLYLELVGEDAASTSSSSSAAAAAAAAAWCPAAAAAQQQQHLQLQRGGCGGRVAPGASDSSSARPPGSTGPRGPRGATALEASASGQVALDACRHCGRAGERTVLLQDGLVYCRRCYSVEYVLLDHDKPSYKDPPKEAACFSYKRSNHFNEWINQVQGKETTEIPDEVYDQILLEVSKQKVTNMASLNRKKVKDIMKKLGLCKYYEHAPHVINRLNGVPSPQFSPALEAQLRQMFQQIQGPFVKHMPPDRKNFLSYSYTIHKMMQLLGEDEHVGFFSLLKARDKLYVQDCTWRKICADVGWEFIPSL